MVSVHFEDQPKIYQMLRVFDNTCEFGPCVGMTRLERWERAQALGLNPPPEVGFLFIHTVFIPTYLMFCFIFLRCGRSS